MKNRKIINKHIFKYGNTINNACKAIRLNGIVKADGIEYNYIKETNTLVIDDGITKDFFEPCILDSDLIFPFYKQKDISDVQW